MDTGDLHTSFGRLKRIQHLTEVIEEDATDEQPYR